MRLILAILLLSSVVVSAQTNRPLYAVNTIADLVARRTVNNERVIVAGWVTPGDWGAERIMRHDPESVLATNWVSVYAANGVGRYLAEDANSLTVDTRWFGGTNDVTTLARALSHVLSLPSPATLVSQTIVLADTVAPTAHPGTMALYSTNVAGAHELAIAHGGGSNNVVATKAWVASSAGSGTVTSIGATSSVAGLSFSGSPVTTTGTLGLTGVVGEASIDAALLRDAEAATLYQATNANLTTVANLTGGTTENFLRGDGTFAQILSTSAYELTYGTNTWRQVIVGTVSSGGFEFPIFEWQKTTNSPAGYYYDLGYLGDTWRTSITNVVVVGGFEMPVFEHQKL